VCQDLQKFYCQLLQVNGRFLRIQIIEYRYDEKNCNEIPVSGEVALADRIYSKFLGDELILVKIIMVKIDAILA
jgi:hypothetical protein